MVQKVFIADDNEDFVLLFGQALNRINPEAKCMSAPNGYDALSQLKFMLPALPDFIFVDVKMPIMNGYEIVHEIKTIPELNQVPVIMYSAVEAEMSQQELQFRKIKKFYLKPSTKEELEFMLWDVIKTKAQ